MKKIILPVSLLCIMSVQIVQADLYVEIAFEGGGDDLIGTNTGDELSAGGGVKIAAGVQNTVNEEGTASIRLSVGYLFDDIDAANGSADIDTMTFDAIYAIHSGPHTFGFGATMHIEPEYKDNVSGFVPLNIQFDDAYGVVLQYGYHITHGLEFGARLTNMDYESRNISINADSFGIYLSNGF